MSIGAVGSHRRAPGGVEGGPLGAPAQVRGKCGGSPEARPPKPIQVHVGIPRSKAMTTPTAELRPDFWKDL
jgi:hypothetical protein